MTTDFQITVDMGKLLELPASSGKIIFANLSKSVADVARYGHAGWSKLVQQAPLWQGEKAAYLQSLQWKMTGDYSAEIWSDYRHAYEIDNGRPPYDLKKMLNTSTKVRRTKDGRRFLVIPMRHNVDSMPSAVYSAAKGLDASTVVRDTFRPAGQVVNLSPTTGMTPARRQPRFMSDTGTKKTLMVASKVYNWGDRLHLTDKRMSKATKRLYAGMVRFDTTAGGKVPSSSYLTFRIMMEGSKGWIVKARPGLHLAKKLTDSLRPMAEAEFSAAMQIDITSAAEQVKTPEYTLYRQT